MTRERLPDKRPHITQKAKLGPVRTVYLSVDSETNPKELFIRVKGNADAEKVTCYDAIARLASLALQYGVPAGEIGELLRDMKDDTGGPVRQDKFIKFCGGTLDYIGTHLLVYYAGRVDLAHVKPETSQ